MLGDPEQQGVPLETLTEGATIRPGHCLMERTESGHSAVPLPWLFVQ